MVFGTFSERSFPLKPEAVVRIPLGQPPPANVRDWLAHAHAALAGLLPANAKPALLTSDLTNGGCGAVDVFKHFDIDPAGLGSLRSNWHGLAHTAQASGGGREGQAAGEAWPEFDDAWIPSHDSLQLAARVGWSRDGAGVRSADALVILPGLLGDNQVLRTRELAIGLRRWGFHVVALELRGHGMTDQRTPDAAYTFSALETLDLLAVSRWLHGLPHVRRTGLIGFCWGANHALCAAWYDGCRGDHAGVAPMLAAKLDRLPDERHYDAGILAFSPVLRFEELLDKLDTKRSRIREPALAGLQSTVRQRMERKRYPDPSGSLRALIARELNRSKLRCAEIERDAHRFVRMLPYGELSDDEKLQCARVPVLIVHAANDPLAEAQALADLFEKTNNPAVAGLLLPGGGHVGFAAYARDYYYSLIVNYFDPQRGAVRP